MATHTHHTYTNACATHASCALCLCLSRLRLQMKEPRLVVGVRRHIVLGDLKREVGRALVNLSNLAMKLVVSGVSVDNAVPVAAGDDLDTAGAVQAAATNAATGSPRL